MPDIETLRSLLARVEAAEGPSNELDARILCALFAPSDAHVEKSQINGRWCIYHGTDRSGNPRLFNKPRDVPNDIWISNISASIDAVVALIERVLPSGWTRIDVWNTDDVKQVTASVLPLPVPNSTSSGKAATAPLALLGALLRALIAKEEGRAV